MQVLFQIFFKQIASIDLENVECYSTNYKKKDDNRPKILLAYLNK